MIEQQKRIPDLVINRCPVSCEDCKGIYLNRQIRHRIICRCLCHTLAGETQERGDKLQGSSLVASPESGTIQHVDLAKGECSRSHYYRVAVKENIAEDIARIGLNQQWKKENPENATTTNQR